MAERWMSVAEIAEYLGVKRDTIYKWRLLQNPLGHKPSGLHLGDFLLDFR